MEKSGTVEHTLPTALQQSLLECAPLAIAVLRGADHRIQFANQRFLQLAEGRDLQGQPFSAALPELNTLESVLDRVYAAQQAAHFSAEPLRMQTVSRVGQENCQLDWFVQPVRTADGNAIFLFAQAISESMPAYLASLYAQDLKRMCELSSSLFVVVGSDTRFRRVSPTFNRLLGWESEETLGKTISAFIHPDDIEVMSTQIQAVLEGNQGTRFQSRMLRKNKDYRWISWIASRIPEEEAAYVTGRDITEAKETELALLRESEANAFRIALSDAIRPLNDPHAIEREAARVIGETFKVTRVNFAVIEGDSATIHQEYTHEVPSAVGKHPVASYQRALETASEPQQTLVIDDVMAIPHLPDTERQGFRHFQIAALVAVRLYTRSEFKAALAIADSRVRHWTHSEVKLFEEAAERVWSAVEGAKAEAALRRTEERYRLLSHATNDVIWDWNPDSGEIEWNKASLLQFGFDADKLASNLDDWLARVHPEDRDRVMTSFSRAMEGGEEVWNEQYRFRKSDGAYATFLDRGHIGRDDRGKVLRVIGSMLNVTERQRTEEALREANAKLVESDQRKDEFLAMLAHELRNPLAAMHNAVELLGLAARDETSRRYLEVLQRQSHTLGGLVDDLLDVSRVTRGLIVLRQDQVDIRRIGERAIESIRRLAEEKQHRIQHQLANQPVLVQGDPVRLEQILVNLLTNSIKYTDPGGELRLQIDCEDDRAVVRVSDSGIGIAKDMQERIFDLFGQAERGLDRAQGGLGIGLTIVKRLVAIHGGDIKVHSAGRGQGTEFVVTLPLAIPTETTENVAPSPRPSPAQGKRVLIVDDNNDVADTLSSLLQAAGHEVASATNGHAALATAEHFGPDLVLLDIGLPDMDGYEVARHLRNNPLTRHSVLAALTGYGQESDRQSAEAAGFDAHLVKPVDFQVLNDFVNGVPAAYPH